MEAGTLKSAEVMEAVQMQPRAHRYPVEVPVVLGAASGRTHNISVTGVLFEISGEDVPDLRGSIQFSLLFGGSGDGPRLRMECIGRAVRVEEADGSVKIVAATIETTRVATYFPAAVEH